MPADEPFGLCAVSMWEVILGRNGNPPPSRSVPCEEWAWGEGTA